jgi:hypothetical protein
MPEQPPVLNTPFRFPKFNPGVTLTSAPFRPSAQVVGDPRNVVKQLDPAAFLPPPPVAAPTIAKPTREQMMQQLYGMPGDNRFGGGRSNGYTTSGGANYGMRSSSYGSLAGGAGGKRGLW